MTPSTAPPIELGTFSTSTGRVIVVDGAYADLWRGHELSDDRVDLRVHGPDSFDAGLAFDLSSHPLYLYDVEPDQVAEQMALFEQFVAENGFDATIAPLTDRVAHVDRVDLHFATGAPQHGIELEGVWAAAAEGLEPGHTYPVVGIPFSDETPFAERWKEVSIVVAEGDVATSELRGYAAVDCGNLLVIDPAALEDWSEGGDAGDSMSYLSAAGAVEQSPHQTTVVPFGDDAAFFFNNRWGDGLFEVYADYDADGRLLRIRAEVGSERTRKRYLSIMDRMGDGPVLALVSRAVLEGAPPRFIYRSEPDHERDSGWRILEGGESKAFLADNENVGIARVGNLAEQFESLVSLLDSPPGSVYERSNSDGEWKAVEDGEPS